MTETETEVGWIAARVVCLSCFKRWVAVYPENVDGPFLECPRCEKMAGQPTPIEDDDIEEAE